MDIEATSVPSPTMFGVTEGVDIDIRVTRPDGREVEGAVTLVRSEADGTWSSWGCPDHWCCADLLDAVDRCPDALIRIARVAAEAIEADCDIETRLAHI